MIGSHRSRETKSIIVCSAVGPLFGGLPLARPSSSLATIVRAVWVAARGVRVRHHVDPRLPDSRKLYNPHLVQYSGLRWKAIYPHHLEMMSA